MYIVVLRLTLMFVYSIAPEFCRLTFECIATRCAVRPTAGQGFSTSTLTNHSRRRPALFPDPEAHHGSLVEKRLREFVHCSSSASV